MKKNTLKKSVTTGTAALLLALSPLSVFAAEPQTTGVVETQTTEESASMQTEVTVDIDSTFIVTIPKKIVLAHTSDTNYASDYTVNVKGDIAGIEVVDVIPDATVELADSHGKASQTATVSQTKQRWTQVELAVVDNASTNVGTTETGNVSANLTAGDWAGTCNFAISLVDTTTE